MSSMYSAARVGGDLLTHTWVDIMIMSDIFGVSALVDLVNNDKPPNATEPAILGPLYTETTQICGFEIRLLLDYRG